MAGTATVSDQKDRTLYTIKATSAGVTVQLTKATRATLTKAADLCDALKLANGLDTEPADALAAIRSLLAKCK